MNSKGEESYWIQEDTMDLYGSVETIPSNDINRNHPKWKVIEKMRKLNAKQQWQPKSIDLT
jgi:hypothetical protein